MPTWDNWVQEWKRACDCIVNRGGTLKCFEIDPPAPHSRIVEVEELLGYSIPSSFRHVLLDFSQRVSVLASSPDNPSCSESLKDVFAVSVMWDIERLPHLELQRQEIVEASERDTLFAPWRRVLLVETSSGGDDIAINLDPENKEEVVLLNLKHVETHQCKLGDNFQQFVDRMTDIGIPIWDSYAIRPFVNKPAWHLDSECENAKAWREWLGYSRM
jgi:SMI1 / KNR4 family (SUKH-1)